MGLSQVIEDLSLIDLGYSGYNFTWDNKRSGLANIQERLERGMANPLWLQNHLNFKITHLTMITSDHCPVLLGTIGQQLHLSQPFRFEQCWTRELMCNYIIDQALKYPLSYSQIPKISKQFNNAKAALKAWNISHFGHIQSCIQQLSKEIDRLQKNPHP